MLSQDVLPHTHTPNVTNEQATTGTGGLGTETAEKAWNLIDSVSGQEEEDEGQGENEAEVLIRGGPAEVEAAAMMEAMQGTNQA